MAGYSPPITAANIPGFIPVIYARGSLEHARSNLVMAQAFAMGNKNNLWAGEGAGGSVIIPKTGNFTVAAYVSGGQVTPQDPTGSIKTITLNKYYECSFVVPKDINVMAREQMIKDNIDESVYVVAEEWDATLCDQVANYTLTAEDAATDTGANFFGHIQGAMTKLDVAKCPKINRVFVVGPYTWAALFGVDQFISGDYKPDQPVETGVMRTILGMPVYMTQNITTVDVSGVAYERNIMAHSGSLGHITAFEDFQVGSYDLEYKGTMYSADALWGNTNIQPTRGVELRRAQV